MRRLGLFKKASELSILCSENIAILVKTPAGKIFEFGHPSADSLIKLFQPTTPEQINDDEGSSKCEESLRRLEREKRERTEDERDLWWDEESELESMELEELEEYAEALQLLRVNVLRKVEDIETLNLLKSLNYCSTSWPIDQDLDYLM